MKQMGKISNFFSFSWILMIQISLSPTITFQRPGDKSIIPHYSIMTWPLITQADTGAIMPITPPTMTVCISTPMVSDLSR